MTVIGDAMYGINTSAYKDRQCPLCETRCHSHYSAYSSSQSELRYKCKCCNLEFSLHFVDNDVFQKQLKVKFTCPDCNKQHVTEVVQEQGLSGRFVPCEPCWEYDEALGAMGFGAFI